eukprot:GHRR01019119.1.p1 GENE.GHRR01019119.1~~GHRR01019119.1.p1  ORF type:complete len:267 (-),score=80.64 GHRR01019119.1:614-1414(-)
MTKVHTPPESVQRFLDTEDLSLLEKPMVFGKNLKFKQLQCCYGAILACSSSCISPFVCPIGTFCPFTTYDEYSLRLDKDSVQLNSAVNDCCCHVASKKKTVPLEKIQDVELQESCLHTCFGLKIVNVQTAGQGGPVPEVTAAFLQSPAQAREAIQLAVRLYHQRATAPIPLSSMDRNAAPAAANSSAALAGTLRQRLQSLNQLVAREVLSKSEADGLKVAVLAAVNDPTARLGEAADLVDQGLITHAEFALLKANIVRQLKDDARP